MTFLARAALAACVGALCAGLGSVTPASASPAPSTAVPCVTPAVDARSDRGADTPRWRRHDDTTAVTAQDLAALPTQETRPDYVSRQVEPRLATHVQVNVFVHVIKGTHRGERNAIGPRRVARMLWILNNAMAGNQNQLSAFTRYRFHLSEIDWTKRDGWYHAFFNGPRDQRMKHRLHRGSARTLNVYINNGGPTGQPVLGWSRFPWQYAEDPALDGVSINAASLLGGKANGYNLGDTLVHETGHWLGLLHTFQGGCGAQGDLVADTAAEAEPSYYCETTRDTCPSPGTDPVRNFMDYSLDSCMNLWTPGQARRVDAAFEKWRLHGQ